MDPELTGERRHALYDLARRVLEAHLRSAPLPDLPEAVPASLRRGAFVSLHAHRALRGCIGRISDDRPLAETVRGLTVAAASEDPRFPPVSLRELPHLEIEISVLSTPVPLDPSDPQVVRLGRHGLIVRSNGRSGVLLPQVALERCWSAEQFLVATCTKAGLRPSAWREPGTEVLTFTADIIGGPE